MARNALGKKFDSAAGLSKRLGSMWNCLWGHALKRSPGINRKSRVLYRGTGFLSSATWPSLPKKHYNGLINQNDLEESDGQTGSHRIIYVHQYSTNALQFQYHGKWDGAGVAVA